MLEFQNIERGLLVRQSYYALNSQTLYTAVSYFLINQSKL